jgi:uncharacterized protein
MRAVDLKGRRVLVTGASGGIGGAIARTLHSHGADLVLTGRRRDALEALAADLSGAQAIPADLSREKELDELVARAGRIDVLVSNAGLPASGALEEFTREQVDRALDLNLRAPIHLVHALTPGMVEHGEGHLVFVASMLGKVASPRTAIYAATKYALRGFAFGLLQDLHGTGVGVTTVFPAFVADAGLFAETGVKLPPGLGSVSADAVARAVARGIERGRAEIDVAPLQVRLGAKASAIVPPRVTALVQRRLGGVELADRIARAQSPKR